MSTTAAWRAGVASDPGLQRSDNEDRVFVDEAAGVFLVVDGVGGQAAGEKAAQSAAEAIARGMTEGDGSPEERVRLAITAANNEIFHLAQENDQWRGMACVLTLAFAHDEHITVGHVGDSRLYLVWDGKLRKLTPDHSPVGEQDDRAGLRRKAALPRHVSCPRDDEIRHPGIEPQRRQHFDLAPLPVRLVEQLHQAVAGEIAARRKQRIDDDFC